MKRSLVLIRILAASAAFIAAAQPAAAAPAAAPPAGWVKAQVVGGGCDSAGHCSSSVKPGSPTLYEYKPNRQPVGRDFAVGADRSQHGGYPTYASRDKCHIGSVDYYWSAGIWHHGGYWTLTFDAQGREHWSGPTRQHWAFEHNDTCQAVPTPIPTATATAVALPPGVTASPMPPPTDVPVPTTPPQPCTSSRGKFDTRANLRIDVPNVPATEYAWDAPIDYVDASGIRQQGVPIWEAYPFSVTRIPPAAHPAAPVPLATPLTIVYDLAHMKTGPVDGGAYDDNHPGQAHIAFGLRDLTTAQDLLLIDTRDAKELKAADGRVIKWNRTLKIITAQIAPALQFLPESSQVYANFDRLHSGAWWPVQRTPAVNKYIAPNLGSSLVQLTPQSGHSYLAWSWNGQGSCWVEAPRWTVAAFTAPLPPTPTPLPPPPPLPQARFTVSIHSTLDPKNGDSSTRNAVYTSSGGTIAWPAGEVLDFTPRVQMVLSPAAPSYPGYAFRAHVDGWSYIGSLGQRAASAADGMGRAGCRGSGALRSGSSGTTCGYRYIGGASLSDSTTPTEADMASQAHVYWAASAPPSMRPDVYVYTLGRLRQADLKVEVRIVVEVVNVATGAVVASRTTTATGTFGVALVVPRSAK